MGAKVDKQIAQFDRASLSIPVIEELLKGWEIVWLLDILSRVVHN